MGIELQQSAPDTLVVNLWGVLSHEEFTASQRSAAEILERDGPKRLLINAEGLTTFSSGGDWGDLSFQLPDRLIMKMAIVGDPQFRDLALMFTGKGFRKFPIEFFNSKERQNANWWLQKEEPSPDK